MVILPLLLRFKDWAVTPIKVRQDASVDVHGDLKDDRGWPYRLKKVPPDLNDKAIVAAIANGKRVTDEPRRLASAGIHPKAEEGR